MAKCTVSGKPQINSDTASVPNSEKRDDGQYVDHFVMCDDEMHKKGFIRPIRLSYKHLKCGGITTMPHAIAETYACDPAYYGSTFCCICGGYFPVGPNGEFIWLDNGEKVGS